MQRVLIELRAREILFERRDGQPGLGLGDDLPMSCERRRRIRLLGVERVHNYLLCDVVVDGKLVPTLPYWSDCGALLGTTVQFVLEASFPEREEGSRRRDSRHRQFW